jgi:hypothetical protein
MGSGAEKTVRQWHEGARTIGHQNRNWVPITIVSLDILSLASFN